MGPRHAATLPGADVLKPGRNDGGVDACVTHELSCSAIDCGTPSKNLMPKKRAKRCIQADGLKVGERVEEVDLGVDLARAFRDVWAAW